MFINNLFRMNSFNENKRFLSFYLFFLVASAMTLVNGSVYEIEKDKYQLILWSSVPTVGTTGTSISYLPLSSV